MNYRLISHFFALIVLSIGVLFIFSFAVDWFYEPSFEEKFCMPWLFIILFVLFLALVFRCFGSYKHTKLFRREGIFITGVGWLMACFLGALPYYFIVPGLGFVDAFFESVSGLTTTGASIFQSLDGLSPGILFWRSISQWIGGLGVVVFFVAILSSLGAGAKFLYANESSGQAQDADTGRIQAVALKILTLYLVISLACVLTFKVIGLEWLHAITLMFTTISTGGFSFGSVDYNSINSPALNYAGIVFMLLGSTSFYLWMEVFKKSWKGLFKNAEVNFFYFIILVTAVIFPLAMYYDPRLPSSTMAFDENAFQVVSLITTAGFVNENYNMWPAYIKFAMLIAMIIAGCSGSTSGGVKVIRALISWELIKHQVILLINPRIVRTVKLNNKVIDNASQEKVLTFIAMFGFFFALEIIVFSLLEPQLSLLGVVSGVITCLSNVGPGFNELLPNFAFLNDFSKVFLSFLMLLGRLEYYALLGLFVPLFWRRFY